MNVILPCRLRGVLIQRHHRFHCLLKSPRVFLPDAVRRTENAGSERFRQNEQITHAARIVLPDPVRMHGSRDRKAVFYTVIRNRMTAGERSARLLHLFRAAAHDFSEDIQIHLFRKADNIQGCPHLSAHRIDVA